MGWQLIREALAEVSWLSCRAGPARGPSVSCCDRGLQILLNALSCLQCAMNNELPLRKVSLAKCIPRWHHVLPGKDMSQAILGPYALVLLRSTPGQEPQQQGKVLSTDSYYVPTGHRVSPLLHTGPGPLTASSEALLVATPCLCQAVAVGIVQPLEPAWDGPRRRFR